MFCIFVFYRTISLRCVNGFLYEYVWIDGYIHIGLSLMWLLATDVFWST